MASKFLKIERTGRFTVGRLLQLAGNYDTGVSVDANLWVQADNVEFITKGYHKFETEDGSPAKKLTPVIVLGFTNPVEKETWVPIKAGITVTKIEDLRWSLSEDDMKNQIEALIAGGEQTITCCCHDHEEDEAEDATEEK